MGRFEEAGEGTIFLDEIGDLPLEMQAKLLRVLQEKTFSAVGGGNMLPLRSRVLAATNQDLHGRIAAGLFRKDLYFRISPLSIHVPALRNRQRDIPELVSHLIERQGKELGSKVSKIEENDIQLLQQYDWPGNVRELENVILQSLLQSPGEILNLSLSFSKRAVNNANKSLNLTLLEVERHHIAQVLDQVDWNFGNACKILQISRPTLRKKIADYQLQPTRPDNHRNR